MEQNSQGYELDPTLPAFALAWDAYSMAVQARAETEQALEDLRAEQQAADLSVWAQGWDRHARLSRLNNEMTGRGVPPSPATGK